MMTSRRRRHTDDAAAAGRRRRRHERTRRRRTTGDPRRRRLLRLLRLLRRRHRDPDAARSVFFFRGRPALRDVPVLRPPVVRPLQNAGASVADLRGGAARGFQSRDERLHSGDLKGVSFVHVPHHALPRARVPPHSPGHRVPLVRVALVLQLPAPGHVRPGLRLLALLRERRHPPEPRPLALPARPPLRLPHLPRLPTQRSVFPVRRRLRRLPRRRPARPPRSQGRRHLEPPRRRPRRRLACDCCRVWGRPRRRSSRCRSDGPTDLRRRRPRRRPLHGKKNNPVPTSPQAPLGLPAPAHRRALRLPPRLLTFVKEISFTWLYRRRFLGNIPRKIPWERSCGRENEPSLPLTRRYSIL
mmetsp:Transcript_17251/g.52469  ORF Transcript_17251/g.52469 Transcript_17251/m.52469 type:complete len:357 (-) Transcript_17251:19-1089(-)